MPRRRKPPLDTTIRSMSGGTTTAAVTPVTTTTTYSSLSNRPESDVRSLLDSDTDDDVYIEEDIDEIFAAVLAENEHHAAAVMSEVESLDADLALALRLQEEEELEKEKEERQKRSKNPWGTTHSNSYLFSAPPTPATLVLPTTSFSKIMGSAPGIPVSLSTSQNNTNNSSNKGAPSSLDFPLLAPPPPPSTTITTTTTSTSAAKLSSFTQPKKKKTSALLSSVPSNTNSAGVREKSDSTDVSMIKFLDSYDAEAIEARATALRYSQAAAAKAEEKQQPGGASRETFKKMMDSSKTDNTSKNIKEEEEETDNGTKYSRRKIRTLVMSMIASGWEFMPDRRGSGHYIYQRFIPPTGHKQILVLPCTPSSQRSIEAVHSRLQRMDREAAEVRAAAMKELEKCGGKDG